MRPSCRIVLQQLAEHVLDEPHRLLRRGLHRAG